MCITIIAIDMFFCYYLLLSVIYYSCAILTTLRRLLHPELGAARPVRRDKPLQRHETYDASAAHHHEPQFGV